MGAFNIAESLLELDLLLDRLKYSPDQPRDDHGRFGEGGSGIDPLAVDELRVSSGPMAGVNFRIGTLGEVEQKVVRETLDQLGTKYPEVVKQIESVQATELRTRWGSMDDQGRMKLTNLGEKYGEKYADPNLDATVAHEFGHAMFRDMAGISGPNDPPPRSSDRDTIDEYNVRVRVQAAAVEGVVRDMYQQVRDELGGDSAAIHEQLVKEFTENPHYVAGRPQELLAQAFGHYATGEHGVIADIVGHAVDEHYGRTAAT